MEISIERSPQHWCPSRGSNSQPLDPEFDALDRAATDPQARRGENISYIQEFISRW